MKLIGYLMEEHRIIEKTLSMFEFEIKRISEENHIDPISMYISIDFIRTYVDLAHQGKEEGILFRELLKKDLLPEHVKIMNELIEEHKYARSILANWMNPNNTPQEIISHIKEVAQFYPQHIKKENEHFYYAIQDYFGAEEHDKMIREFTEYDKNILHWKYQKTETVLEKRDYQIQIVKYP